MSDYTREQQVSDIMNRFREVFPKEYFTPRDPVFMDENETIIVNVSDHVTHTTRRYIFSASSDDDNMVFVSIADDADRVTVPIT